MVLSQCAPAASIPLRTCPKRQNRLGVVSLNIYRALQSGSNGTARSGLRRKRHSRILVSTISGPGLPKPCVMLPIDGGASPSFSRHRSEEHTSELQSLMRISYAVFCLKKKNTNTKI